MPPVAPGRSTTDIVVFSNNLPVTQRYRVGVTAGLTAGNSGSAYGALGTACAGTACWVTGIPRAVTLPPHTHTGCGSGSRSRPARGRPSTWRGHHRHPGRATAAGPSAVQRAHLYPGAHRLPGDHRRRGYCGRAQRAAHQDADHRRRRGLGRRAGPADRGSAERWPAVHQGHRDDRVLAWLSHALVAALHGHRAAGTGRWAPRQRARHAVRHLAVHGTHQGQQRAHRRLDGAGDRAQYRPRRHQADRPERLRGPAERGASLPGRLP
jgi:hypothetical protein